MDLERSLISHVTDATDLARCWDLGLRPEVFDDITNKQVYAFAIDYWHDNSMKLAPTEDVIKEEFPGVTLEAGSEAVQWLVETIQKRFQANQIQTLLLDVSDDVADNPQKALENLYVSSWSIREATSSRLNRLDLSENHELRHQRYLDRISRPENLRGAPLGFDMVDEHVGCFLPGELAAMVGSTGTGKSFAILVAANKAREAGFTPYVATLEMSVDEFADRSDCIASGVGYGKFQSGQLTDEELDRLQAARESMSQLGSIFVEQPPRGSRTVIDLVSRARQLGCDYLIIDQLSHMDARPSKWKKDLTEQNAEIIYELKDEINTEPKIPCLLAVQFNREAAAVVAKGGKPAFWHIANSSDIERTVDFAFSIFRTKEMRAMKVMLLDIMKSRRSDNGTWILNWKLNRTTELSVRGEYDEAADLS